MTSVWKVLSPLEIKFRMEKRIDIQTACDVHDSYNADCWDCGIVSHWKPVLFDETLFHKRDKNGYVSETIRFCSNSLKTKSTS